VPLVPEASISRLAIRIARSTSLKAFLALAPVPLVPEASISRIAIRIARSARSASFKAILALAPVPLVPEVGLRVGRRLFIAISASVEIDANCR
jgi:hypothetical protein